MIKEKVKTIEPTDIVSLLGGGELVGQEIRSGFDLIKLSRSGLKKSSLDALIGHLGMSKKSFTENILNLSVKTFERKKGDDLLDRRTSSYLIEIAKVTEHVFEVFEDEEKVQRWLNKPNKALAGNKPIDLFETPTGLNMVDRILGRIEEGVYT